MRKPGRILFLQVLVFCLLWACTAAAEESVPTPSERDLCPVCGMFVAKYPDWIATIEFKDGKAVFFDGVKDLLKFYFDIKHYQPDRSTEDIRAIHVTDYYTGGSIQAQDAYYVFGSDVFGPMGKELIPLDSLEAADEFMRDHNGIRVLRFNEIRPSLVDRLR
ncbi:MAG: nitrous oxide reductase accessory protein NosL [Desulfobacterales bacterium]